VPSKINGPTRESKARSKLSGCQPSGTSLIKLFVS
jgi:hypothetical protein